MVSELEFKRYVAVQFSGLYNMITEARWAMDMIEMDMDTYCKIQDNYKELVEKYPEAYEEGKKIGQTMSSQIYG